MNISGGTGRLLFAHSGSTVNISGGTIGSFVSASSGSTVSLFGEEFQIDGQLLPGLGRFEDRVQVNIPEGSVVAGVLSDGTVISMPSRFGRISDGTLTLVRGPDLLPIPPVINVPTDPAPRGLRGGQTLNLHDGGEIGDDFNTLADSTVNVMVARWDPTSSPTAARP